MKRITNKICAVLLSGIFMVMTGVNVNAAEQEYPPAEAVFPEEKVLQIENQIKNTPIYNDKDAEGNFSLKNTRATGTYPTRYGVILVTADKYKGLIPTGHAGIIWTSSTIVESLSNGVTTGPNDWNTSKTSCYGMEWLDRGINMVFLDNPTVSSDYIRQMMTTAEQQDIVTKTAMESIIKLLIIVELDRGEKQRLYISQSIKDGIAASNKKSGRKPGQLDKMSDALREDILKYLSDRSIKQVDLMRKYNISRNTLKKYVYKIQNHNII